MLGKFKKGLTLALATSLCLATVSASAAEWRRVDYNTSAIENGVSVTSLAVPVVYQEFDDLGLPTGRMVEGEAAVKEGLVGWANVTVGGTWVSDVYPNDQYAKLYADGNYTGRVIPTGLFGEAAGVEYRDVNFMWEVAAPHRIYAATQAKLFKDGVVQWFASAEKNYPIVYSGENAAVTHERAYYGFADYKVTGENTVSIVPEHMAAYTEASVYEDIEGIEAWKLAPEYVTVDYKDDCDCVIRGIDALGRCYVEGFIDGVWDRLYVTVEDWKKMEVKCDHEPDCVCDACTYKKSIWPKYSNPYRYEVAYDTEIKIPRTYEHVLVGPAFDADGNKTGATETVKATEYKAWVWYTGVDAAGNEIKWQQYEYAPQYFNIPNLLSTENARVSGLVNDLNGELSYCDITWTKGGYETTEPHKVYEFLTVDGVVMDGSMIGTVEVKVEGGTVYQEVYKPFIYRYTGATANVAHRTVVDSVVDDELVVRTEAYVDGVWVTCARSYTGQRVNHETRYAYDSRIGAKTAVNVYVFSYAGERYEMYETVPGTWHVNDWDYAKDWAGFFGDRLEEYVPEA
ncbi:MAG: hypothetical protein ACI3XA_03135 [Clostridia bacterium]